MSGSTIFWVVVIVALLFNVKLGGLLLLGLLLYLFFGKK
jgi:hypothetical protein